jgi:RNA polymerase sigma factor (sigma-70 family)
MVAQIDNLNRYIQEIKQHPRITPKREKELSKMILQGKRKRQVEAAIEELVLSNLLLVVHCLKDFTRHVSSPHVTLNEMDLIAEGNIALMHAARGYNAQFKTVEGGKTKRSVRFSTYACKCIKRRMLRAIRLSSFIHIPEYHFTCRRRMAELESIKGDVVSDREVERELGIGSEKLGMIRQGKECQTYKLEDMTMNDGATDWSDYMEDEEAVNPSEEMQRSDLRRFLLEEMEKLQPRTRTIVAKLFLSERKVTLGDLSKQFNISKERCRQICVKGLKTLRKQLMPRWGKTIGIGLGFGSHESDVPDGASPQPAACMASLAADVFGSASLQVQDVA